MKVIDTIEDTGILPVINIPKPEYAIPLVDAMKVGGINAIEVTLRSESSLESINRIKSIRSDYVVGAGTVLSAETAEEAIKAGADFIVSPGFDEETVDYCMRKGVEIVAGCTSATEIQKGLKKGVTVFKFFPGELSGGVGAIKLLSGPFPKIKFLPTGGINFDNLGAYLANDKVLACGGSFVAPSDMIKSEDYKGITEACKKAVDISLGFELAHVGVNDSSAEEAVLNATALAEIFRLPVKDGNSSTFSGTAVEFMKKPCYGTKGHIGFRTNSVKRALAFFKKRNIAVIEESIKQDDKGLISAYLKDEIGGFAIHVVRK